MEASKGESNGREPTKDIGAPSALYADEAQISFHYPEEKQLSLFDVLLVLAQNRKIIFVSAAVFTLLGIVMAITPEDHEYVASATVIREGESGQSAGGGLQRFGIDLGNSTTGLTADLYPDILASREVRLSVVRDTFYIATLDTSMTFVDFYFGQSSSWWEEFTDAVYSYTIGLPKTAARAFQKESVSPMSSRSVTKSDPSHGGADSRAYPTPAEELAMMAAGLRVSTNVDRQSGLMTVKAKTVDPSLSAELISSFLNQLERRVREIHTTKSATNLEYVRSRFEAARQDFVAAEDELARFMDRNVQLQTAQARTQFERLQRDVDRKGQLYLNLQNQLTQAEIEMQRSLPVITVLEPPVPPLGPVGSSPETRIFFGLFFGCLFGIVVVFGKWFIETQSTDEGERLKLDELRESLSSGTIGRRLRSMRGVRPQIRE